MKTISDHLICAAIVPGLPHIMQADLNEGYRSLVDACEKLGDELAQRGVQRIVYYSTQWLSVLGQSFQARAELKGHHVDENWHDFANLDFDFRVDTDFAKAMAAGAENNGFQTKLINYDGFPVDTGTIIADRFLNKGRFITNMVSSCVYSDNAETEKLGAVVRNAIDESAVPTAVVGVSMLSGRFFTTEIDLREDHIRDESDDAWNRRMLDWFENGEFSKIDENLAGFCSETKADMGFKAYSFIKGTGACQENNRSHVMAYGAIYGTGAAVLEIN